MALPSGYKRLEYIQSTGTQYIDTGVPHSLASKITLDATVEYTDVSGTQIMGFSGNAGYGIGVASGKWWDMSGSSITATVGTKYHISFYSEGAKFQKTIDSTTISGSRVEYSQSKNMLLFAAWDTMSASVVSYHFRSKIYEAKVFVSGTLVRDFIPCENTSSVVGLWDDVNGVFYANAGTGTFVAGPEVVYAPATPENFQVCECAKPNVVLEWSVAEHATGYNLYRDGEFIASVLDTTYTDRPPSSGSFVYALEAYNDSGVSESVSVGVLVDFCPEAPEGFRVTSQSCSCVCICWDAVSCETYLLYRDGELLAETSATEYEDTTVTANRAYTYSLRAVDAYGESPAVMTVARTVDPLEPMHGLVTDRTLADYLHWQELRDKGFANMTEAEREEWTGASMKGSYGVYDLNRVGTALNYVRDRLTAAGYLGGNEFEARVDWVFGEIPETEYLTYYLGAVAVIREAMAQWRTTPATPADVGSLNYQDANAIEQILVDIDQLITNMLAARHFCGDLYSGEV